MHILHSYFYKAIGFIEDNIQNDELNEIVWMTLNIKILIIELILKICIILLLKQNLSFM